jgi:hypothetical protein
MKSLLKLWALLVPLALMGSFGGGSFGSGSSISANGKGMQGSQGSGASAPAPDFSLYDIASGPSQLAGTATYNGTELTTVLECFGEGFTEGVGLVCTTGGTWTENSDGVFEREWGGAWSDPSNEHFALAGGAGDGLLAPSTSVLDMASGADFFVESVVRSDALDSTQALIGSRERSDDGNGFAAWVDSGGRFSALYDCGASNTGTVAEASASMSSGAWSIVHMVSNRDPSTGNAIVLGTNGAPVAQGGTACDSAFENTLDEPRIGDFSTSAGGYEWDGDIAYIAVRTCSGCVVDESGNTTTDEWIAERFARLTGTYAADGADKIPNLATRASAGYTCHLDDSGVRKCDQVGDNWIRTYDVADTGWDDASATHTTGVLIEEERTNLLTADSSALTASGWNTGNLNGSFSEVPGPMSGSASEFTADAGAATDYHQLNDTATASVDIYSMSAIVKPGAAGWFWLFQSGGTDGDAYFNLSDCSVGTTVGVTDAGAEAWGDGYCRIWFSDSSGSSATLTYGFAEGDGDRQFAGDGSTVTGYIAHTQFELGAYPSSPIVTSGASVTRSADALQYLPFASDVGSSGTFTHVDAAIAPPVVQASYQAVSAIDDASSPGFRSRHYWRSTRFDLDADGGGGILFDSANWGASEGHGFFTTTKGTFEPGVIATAYVNGSASGSPDPAGDTPANIDRVSIGVLHTGTYPFQGVITCSATYDGVALTEDDGVCE